MNQNKDNKLLILLINNKIQEDLDNNHNNLIKKSNLLNKKVKISLHLKLRAIPYNIKISKENNIKGNTCIIKAKNMKQREEWNKNILKYSMISLRNKKKINKPYNLFNIGQLGERKCRRNTKKDYKMANFLLYIHIAMKNQ